MGNVYLIQSRQQDPIELMREIEIGIVVVRGEDCRKCNHFTSHAFTLTSIRPRRWVYECLRCSSRLQRLEN